MMKNWKKYETHRFLQPDPMISILFSSLLVSALVHVHLLVARILSLRKRWKLQQLSSKIELNLHGSLRRSRLQRLIRFRFHFSLTHYSSSFYLSLNCSGFFFNFMQFNLLILAHNFSLHFLAKICDRCHWKWTISIKTGNTAYEIWATKWLHKSLTSFQSLILLHKTR